MSHIAVTQGSSEWLEERLGCATGSRMKDALSFLKNGEPSQKQKDYAVELLAERMTGIVAEHYVSREMEWGSNTEREAVAAYEMRTGSETEVCGIFQHDLLPRFLASPDRTVGSDGLLEVKCPKTSTHIEWMLAGVVPEEHLPQLKSELACSNRAWVDFCSYDPRLPLRHQLFIVRLFADNKDLALLIKGVSSFLDGVDDLEATLNERNPPLAAPEETQAAPQWDDAARLDLDAIDAWADSLPTVPDAEPASEAA